jgi:protein-S-isoprenylcysteine O-methyltransferase Ste14
MTGVGPRNYVANVVLLAGRSDVGSPRSDKPHFASLPRRAPCIIDEMPAYAYIIIAAGWLLWFTPFFLIKRKGEAAETLDRRARWGLVLEGLAYSLLWQNKFWARSPEDWRIAFSVLFFVPAPLFSWTGARALGRQWRIDAGLNSDHELVRSGVYRMVRHPIYTSMFCMLFGTGFMITPLPTLMLSTMLFIAGTEIRVRIEEALLAARFGDAFRDYQRAVSAYVPFLNYSRPKSARAST